VNLIISGVIKMPKDTFFNLNVEKQERLIRAAISEFLKNGFEKGNVGNIAKSAGVAKGSMYQYFEDKKEIFMYSLRWAIDLFINKYSNHTIPKGTDIFDYFYQSSGQILQQLREEMSLRFLYRMLFSADTAVLMMRP
jgi:AcrR family transcriptional regulator